MKALKTAAIVVGAVALAATGVGAVAGLAAGIGAASGVGFGLGTLATLTGVSASVFGAAAVATGVGLVTSLLPKASQGGSQTKWKADPYAGLPYVMGRTLVSGSIVAKRGSGGSNTFEHFVTVLSIGPIDAIEANFANKTTLNYGADGTPVSGFYSNRIWQRSQLGACPERVALSPWQGVFPGWTTSHHLSGLAATLVSMKYDSSGKNQLTTEPQMAAILRGVHVYDPRRDDTYPGGSGACRAYDETTYVYSEDPHLHALTFAIGRYQNGKRVFGIGVGGAVPGGKVKSIDVATFVEGANLNDARSWKVGGQIVSRPDTPWNNLKSILQAGGAVPVLSRGVISCINRTPRVSLATITRADIAGECSFSGTQPRRSRINGVVPMYRSEAHDWEMVSATGVIVADYVALDGDERIKEIQFPLVQQVDQATQLGVYEIMDAREAGPGSIPLKPWWLNYRIGDCVTFEPENGFSRKVMITGRGLEAQTGVVTYTVKTETDSKHAFALGQTGTAPPTASIVYDASVAAPAIGDWAFAGVTLSANGASIPALVATGAVGNVSADAVLFDYRVHIDGQTSEAGWNTGGIEGPSTTRKEFAGVTPATAYDLSVRYRVRGVTGDRRILGPVTAGTLSVGTATNAANATTADSVGGAYSKADLDAVVARLATLEAQQA